MRPDFDGGPMGKGGLDHRYPGDWVRKWLGYFLEPTAKTATMRSYVIRCCLSGEWYGGNILSATPEEDRKYFREKLHANIHYRSHP